MDVTLYGADSITEFFTQRFAPVRIETESNNKILGMQGRFGSLL